LYFCPKGIIKLPMAKQEKNNLVGTHVPLPPPVINSPIVVQEKDTLIRNVTIAAGTVTCLVVAVLVVPYAIRDKWEIYERDRILKKLNEADQLQKINPFLAYKTYDEILKESKKHAITDEHFLKVLNIAENSRSTLYIKVQENIKAEEAEKRRLDEAEAKRVADEKMRIVKEQENKRATEEAQRIAEEKKRAEEKRRKEAVSVYLNTPQSARTALNIVKKVEARTEIGVNYADYSAVVGEAWGEVKIFVESPEGKNIPEYSLLLKKSIADYKSALDVWRSKLDYTPSSASSAQKYINNKVGLDILQQHCWSRAGMWLELAESLLSGKDVEKNLEEVEKILEKNANDKDADFDANLNKILLNK
jgi:hypothetical protein